MKTMKIYKTTEKGSELVGEYTAQECKTFMGKLEAFMCNISEMCPYLVFIRGAWSASIWDEEHRETILSYQVEFK